MEQKNISADDMILFATIAEQASLVRAAEQLGMPKATVSRRLTNLEELLGQRLLIRTTRRLTLTEFGQEFFDHSRRVAEEVATVQDFARSQEVQPHGLVFEQWVRNTFFNGYKPASYTQRWGIPASENRDHGGSPVNPKAVKHGTAIDLGDAFRQYEIDEPFLLVVGFWSQEGDQKRIVNIAAPEVRPELWRKLWGSVSYADLLKLDALIKDTGRSVEEIRRLALKMKSSPPFSEAVIQVNPKIDTQGQRRLQCSLRFADFFKHLAPGTNPAPQARPALWGVEYPGPIASPARAPGRSP